MAKGAKFGDLSLVCGAHVVVEEENRFMQAVLSHKHMSTHTNRDVLAGI